MSVVFAVISSLTILFLVFVLLRNYRDPTFLAYFLTGLFWVFILVGVLLTLGWNLPLWGPLLLAVGMNFLPSQATFFSFCFARQNPVELLKRWRWLLGLTYGLSLVFLLQAGLGKIYILGEQVGQGSLLVAYSDPSRLFLAFLFVTTLVSLVNLESTYRLSKGKERQRLRIPIAFSVLTYAWVIYAVSSSFVLGSLAYWILQIGFLFIFLTLFATGFYLLRQRAGQPAVYVGRRLAYSSAAFVLVGSYLVFIGLVASLIPKLGGNLQIFISVLAGLMVLVVLVLLAFWETWKRRLETLIERILYPARFDFREEWKKFSENISALLDSDQIQKEIAKVVTSNLKIENLIIFSRTGRTGDLSATYPPQNNYSGRVALPPTDPFWGWILRYGETVEKRQAENMLESYQSGSAIKQILEETQKVVITPFIANRELVGILLLGPKEPSEEYTQEDFDLLNAISGQAALALLNARIGQELILSREMESFHKFSAYVIHDLKNSISMLSLLLANAQGNIHNPQFQTSALETIDQAVRKMKFLVEKLSSPPEGSTLVLRQSDLNQILMKSIKDLKLELVSNLKVATELAPLPLISCDPLQMEKVFQNLLLNALEAMPKGGRLTISSQVEQSADRASLVKISISDSGIGLAAEYMRSHLFQPFASTKKAGLGIGLYQSKEIVEQHGGRIWAESVENQRTTFYVSLPVEKLGVELTEAKPAYEKR